MEGARVAFVPPGQGSSINNLAISGKTDYLFGMKQTTVLFKALAHQTRLQILCLLLNGEVCVCQIMAILQLPQSTASRHLAILKNAGLVEDRRDGTWAHYSLANGRSALADQLLDVLGVHLPQTREGARDNQKLSDALRKKGCA